MPYRRRKRKFKVRRRRRKRVRKNAPQMSLKYRGGRGDWFPKMFLTKMTCSWIRQPTAAIEIKDLYNINQLRDIRNAATNIYRPMGFDQLNAIYETYCVTAYKYKFVICNTSLTVPFQATVYPGAYAATSTGVSGAEEALEQPRAKTTIVQVQDGGSSVKTISGFYNVNSIEGVKVAKEEDYWGTESASPAKLSRLFLYMRSLDNASSVSTTIQVQLTLYVKWFNQKTVGISTTA